MKVVIARRPHVRVGEPLLAHRLHHVVDLHAQTVHAYHALVHRGGRMRSQIIRFEVVRVQESVHVLVLHGAETLGDQEFRAPESLQIQDA